MSTPIPPVAVIFDFDGVMVDSERLHYEAYQAVLRPQGLGFEWEEYAERYMCYSDGDAIERVYLEAGRSIGPEALGSLIDRKAEAFQRHLGARRVPVFEGVVDLLGEIRDAGLPCAICSAASRTDIESILYSLNLSDFFSVIVSAEDVRVGKPDPSGYRLAVQKTAARCPERGITAPVSLAIEDTPGGVRAARGAGLQVLAVGTTHREQELTEAHWFVDRLTAVSLEDLQRRFAAKGR
jgi:beta-phosphoglucomutase